MVTKGSDGLADPGQSVVWAIYFRRPTDLDDSELEKVVFGLRRH